MKAKEEIFAEIEREMLDDYCSAILILLWKGDEMRFNEIYRELQRKGTTLSKPTLSEHLKHLRRKKWVTRKVGGVQNVSYRLHPSINRSSDAEVKKWLEEMLGTLDIHVIEPSPEMKVDLALNNIIIFKLEELAFRIAIEPKIANFSLSFGKSRSRVYENNLVTDCNKDAHYRGVVLAKTKELLKIFKERLPRLPDS
jgi:DNA-binding HxlR family transcriptional regulator